MTRQKHSFEDTLLKLSEVLISTLDIEKLGELFLNKSLEILNADGGSLMILEDGKQLVIRASRRLDEEIFGRVILRKYP